MTAKDSVKTRDELLAELQQLRRQVAELHAAAGDDRRRAAPGDHEGLLQTIVANVPIIVFAVDRAGIITFSEGQGLERLGRKPGELVGQAVLDVYRDVPGVEQDLFRALGGEPGTVRLKVDGLVLEVWYTSLRDQGGEVVGVAGMAVDVTGHERAEKRLRGGQRLMGQMLQSHEQDRRLIAYEIHDGLVQDATAAQMQLDSVLARPQLPSAVREEVQLAADLVRKSVAQARELISGLRPPILD